MMTLLHLMSYVGGIAGFLFVTLSLASGLLWLAELIEEHSKYAKTVGMRSIYVIIVLHLLLIITDSLPILPTLFSIFAHLIYLTNFSPTWPYISLSSPKFILSCILVVADHFTWFFHFAAKAQEAKRYRGPKYRYGSNTTSGEAPTFMDVAAFFAICVWFVPLFLFLSLSANDNALPSNLASGPPSPAVGGPNAVDLSSPGSSPANHNAFATKVSSRLRGNRSQPLLKTALAPMLAMLPRLRRKKFDDEGLLAPRTPVRGSPLHSPVNMSTSYFPWGGVDEGSSSASGGTGGTPGGIGGNYGNNLTVDTGSAGIPRKPSLQGLGSTPSPTGSQSSSIGLGMRSGSPLGNNSNNRKPPPPRRVQSESINPGSGGLNPRGLATRNGRPVGGMEEGGEDMVVPYSSSSSSGGGVGGQGPPHMSLGPRGGEGMMTGIEVLDSKRKAD